MVKVGSVVSGDPRPVIDGLFVLDLVSTIYMRAGQNGIILAVGSRRENACSRLLNSPACTHSGLILGENRTGQFGALESELIHSKSRSFEPH